MEGACTVVVNPAAGSGRAARLIPQLVATLAATGIEASITVAATPEDAPRLAREAAHAGRTVVACGGDGLVGMLAPEVAAEGGVLAVVPAGSGNDFARHLGLHPRRPLDALRALRSATIAELDLGSIGDRRFCCVASIGFDAEANRWANGARRLRGTPLYLAAALRTLATYRPRSVRVVCGSREVVQRAWLVAVANTPNYAGGMRVAPAARSDDGVLHVTIVGPIGRAAFLRNLPKVFAGTHVEHPAVEVLSGEHVTVESLDGPTPVFADGEPVAELEVVEVGLVPRALRVAVPAGWHRAPTTG